jgi:hypothetical protein
MLSIRLSIQLPRTCLVCRDAQQLSHHHLTPVSTIPSQIGSTLLVLSIFAVLVSDHHLLHNSFSCSCCVVGMQPTQTQSAAGDEDALLSFAKSRCKVLKFPAHGSLWEAPVDLRGRSDVVKALAANANITSLDVSGCRLEVDDYKVLSQSRSITSLTVSAASQPVCAILASNPRLEFLCVTRMSAESSVLPEECLIALSASKSLRSFDVSTDVMGTEVVRALFAMPSLTSLNIAPAREDILCEALCAAQVSASSSVLSSSSASVPHTITSLGVWNSVLTSRSAELIARYFPQLHVLRFDGDDTCLSNLSSLHELHELVYFSPMAPDFASFNFVRFRQASLPSASLR